MGAPVKMASPGKSRVGGLLGFVLGMLLGFCLCASGLIQPLFSYSTGLELGLTTITGQIDAPSVTEKEVAAIRTLLAPQRAGAELEGDALRALMRKQNLADQEVVYKRNIMRRNKRFPELPKDALNTLYYYTPHYVCKQERVGSWHDGGKWMCDPRSFNNDTVVYSIGCNGDVSFETDLREICNGCQIHTFDMTLIGVKMRSALRADTDGIMKFHDYGLSVKDDPVNKLKSLKSIMANLGHTHIDYFKIDCEGCEWKFFEDLFAEWTPGLISQMSIELHFYVEIDRTHKLLQKMEELGYRIFQSELNFKFPKTHMEISVVHESVVKPTS